MRWALRYRIRIACSWCLAWRIAAAVMARRLSICSRRLNNGWMRVRRPRRFRRRVFGQESQIGHVHSAPIRSLRPTKVPGTRTKRRISNAGDGGMATVCVCSPTNCLHTTPLSVPVQHVEKLAAHLELDRPTDPIGCNVSRVCPRPEAHRVAIRGRCMPPTRFLKTNLRRSVALVEPNCFRRKFSAR